MTEASVSFAGNLTDDPEVRFTANGVAVATFRLAVTPRVRQGDTWTERSPSGYWTCLSLNPPRRNS